ncbi:lytic transglycosylase domain-containing protein [Aliarcobacter cryaerophilus]|uniref:lytic transglycosylase domain-containing protein n=1 Tax=Aliarcobacter cryaerophilus TaxID=28198 RepID=UPI0021B550D3|nr:lytic transglycosylase domain-containing protein [Aliarcobacter cryaerophilus]MCT7535875.1 lytic transglycosylase domain-containing protein [Aliarcobacter cryaerophilus]
MIDTLLIEQCKNPIVPTKIVKMIVQEESSKNPYAVNVNKDGRSFISFIPKTKDEAITIAQSYINTGFSVDVGYMQLNSDNFKQLNTTLENALEPCKNIYLSSTIFYNFYKDTSKKDSSITRVQKSLSAYNTGSYELGFKNGYVAKYDKYFEEKYYKPVLIKNL